MEGRGHNFIRSFWPILFLVFLQNVMSVFAMQVTMPIAMHEMPKTSIQDMADYFVSPAYLSLLSGATYLFYSIVGIPILAVVYYRTFVKTDSKYYSRYQVLAKAEKPCFSLKGFSLIKLIPGLIILSLGAFAIVNIVADVMTVINPVWLKTLEDLEEMNGIDENMELPMMIYVLLLGPIVEEIAFRGITTEYLKRAMGFWGAAIVQAILFGMMHMNVLQGTNAAVMGVVYGYVYLKTGNVILTSILHIVNNMLATVLTSLPGADSPVVFFAIIVCSLTMTYGGMLLIKSSKKEEMAEEIY